MNYDTLNLYQAKGWKYIRETPDGIIFFRGRVFSKVALVAGLLLLPAYGLGLLILILGGIDWAVQKERFHTVTREQFDSGMLVLPEQSSVWPMLLVITLALIAASACLWVTFYG